MTDSPVFMLDFEKEIVSVKEKLAALEAIEEKSTNDKREYTRLSNKLKKLQETVYAELTPLQKAQVARHPNRPHCLDYINALISDFVPLSGDRLFGNDEAMVTGIGNFHNVSVAVIGQEKGDDLESRMKYNFGMARPEGYRKAQRIMDLAEKFNMPIITFVDTAGAYPGIDAEERGQAEAIASSIEKCLRVKTPIISVIIGEGGSGGAIAIAVADKVLMLENSIYSVISPEGCASILWRSPDKVKDATEALKLTASDLKKLGVIDEIIKEPLGGAHQDKAQTIKNVEEAVLKNLKALLSVRSADLKDSRTEKFLQMGRLPVSATAKKEKENGTKRKS